MSQPQVMSVTPWLRVGPDLLAGLSIAGVLLPEAVAYAAIAGVQPAHALLAALVGLCVYPWLGTSRFAVVAPTSSAAAVFASAAVASGPAVGYALVAMTGAMFLAAAALRAGFLGAFISRPVLRGFAWALALTIMIRQLPHLAGVQHLQHSQTGPVLWELLPQPGSWHRPSLAVGLAALALWLALHHGLRRWIFVPTSLLVLGLGIWACAALSLEASGVALVGEIAWEPLKLALPDLGSEQWLRVAEIAPALLLILFAESWGSVRSLALQGGGEVNANRELLALGVANLSSGLLHGLPVGAGFSAASANYAAGGRSKWAGGAAALALALMLWLARPWLALLPLPVLAAVVIGILSNHLWPRSVLSRLHLGRDAWLAVVAASGVFVFGALFGMLLAVALSLLLAIRRFAQPVLVVLGQLPGTRDYLDHSLHPETVITPGILIMRPEEPLFFANAEQVLQRVGQRAEREQASVVVLSLEVSDDLDSTAVEVLAEFAIRLQSAGTRLLLARVKDRARQALARAGLVDVAVAADLDAEIGMRSVHGGLPMYWSVDDAARAAEEMVVGRVGLEPTTKGL
jgi:SulP family sulfate permease